VLADPTQPSEEQPVAVAMASSAKDRMPRCTFKAMFCSIEVSSGKLRWLNMKDGATNEGGDDNSDFDTFSNSMRLSLTS
jgi:hypothetical protein